MVDYQDRAGGSGASSPSNGRTATNTTSRIGKRTLTDGLTSGTLGEHVGKRTLAETAAPAAGEQLPYRAEMEAAFGQDFGAVRSVVGVPVGDNGALGAAEGEHVR